MIEARPFFVLVFAVLGWLMLRVGIGAAVLGGWMLFHGNGWALLLFVPAAAGIALGIYAVDQAVQRLAGRGPAGRC